MNAKYLCLVFLLPCCLLTATPAQAQMDSNRKQTKELKQLRQDIKETKKNLTAKQAQEDQLRMQLSVVTAEIKNINFALSTLEQQIKTKNEKAAALVLQSNTLQAEINKQRQDLREQIKAYYLASPHGIGKSILIQDDLNSINRASIYRNFLLKNRMQSFASLKTSAMEFEQIQRNLSQETIQLQTLLLSQQNEKQNLAQQIAKQQSLLTQLAGEIATTEQRLKQLITAEQRLEKVIAELRAKKAEQATEKKPRAPKGEFAALKGKLPLPLAGDIIERFGETRAFSGKRTQGVLIKATQSTEIKSIADGIIVFADMLPGFGRLIIIDHGEGYMSLYGHNQTLYKNKGSAVKAGDIIASLTIDGSNSDAALYFEMRKQGMPMDPLLWCQAK